MIFRILFQPLLAALLLSSLLISSLFAQQSDSLPDHVLERFGPAPSVPDGALSPAMQFAARVAFVDSTSLSVWDKNQQAALAAIAKSGDPRLVWIISDMLRFVPGQQQSLELTQTASDLLGKTFNPQEAWLDVTNHLLAWDIPAPPDYLDYKRVIFTTNIPDWEALFMHGEIDWRLVSWGGVLIDSRAYNNTDEGCNCIPGLDNPELSKAKDTTWLKDDDVVFGIEVNGEARAYPRRIMEVREMVNDTLGGRDLGIPYCTLCGAAQAFYTDRLPAGIQRPVLRTSGLLSRSNKVMYDLNTNSIFDTFLGRAVTGSMAEQNITLPQVTVVATNWGSWKKAHPETTVVLERYALGRNPNFRNGRDANGPIFPIGDVDPRLPVHEDVIGAITASGKAVAFPRSLAFVALSRDKDVAFEDIRLELSAGGIRAVNKTGADLGSHQAFWFAWSQFHPKTELWTP